jgi:RimJ/RimL family protein N-acetyltransferase
MLRWARLVEGERTIWSFPLDQRETMLERMKTHVRALLGSAIRLVPLDESHAERVVTAALSHPEIWRHIPYSMKSESDVRARLALAFALREAGTGVVYATELISSGEVIGGTAILCVDPRVPSFEIGSTWIVPPHQRTRVNTEAKYLQLSFAFEELSAARVELKTDVLNERSRAAIARLGARQEGIFRSHMRRADGSLRDSVFFSITAEEWPRVKADLASKLAGPSATKS